MVPVCGASFTRLAAAVELPGAEAEVALDSGILFALQRQTPLSELEVELKAGAPEAVKAFAEALAAAHGLQPEKKSKFKRALALRG